MAGSDGAWLILGHAVEHAAESHPGDTVSVTTAMSRMLITALDPEDPEVDGSLAELLRVLRSDGNVDAPRLFDHVVRVAEDMEGQGAFNVAFSTLANLRAAFPSAASRQQCAALATQARIAREMGDLEAAEALYEHAADVAREADDEHSMALVEHGRGGVAITRGNWPAATRHYERALELARGAGDEGLIGRAHRGVMAAYARAAKFEGALEHGWEAYRRAPDDRNSRAELLVNLGGVARWCGHHAASFAAYSVAFTFAGMDRIRHPALSSATRAAAMGGQAGLVRQLAVRVEREVATGMQPYERALVLLDLAEAYEAIADDRTEATARRACDAASAHGFHELEHQARQVLERVRASVPPATVPPAPLSDHAIEVLDALAALAEEWDAVSVLTGTREQ